MSKNQQSNNHDLMYLLSTLKGVLDEDKDQPDAGSAGQFINSNPMTIEEGINHVASTYPSEDPISKYMHDELIDELAEITGDELTSDLDRAKYIQDIQQTIADGGLEALDPEVLERLNAVNDSEAHVIERKYISIDDGPRTLVSASINGEDLDITALEEGRVEFENDLDDWLDIQQEGFDNVEAEMGAGLTSMEGEFGVQSSKPSVQEFEQSQPSAKPIDFAPN